MATNRYRHRGRHLSLPIADQSNMESGAAAVVGALPCVLTTDVDDGYASVDTMGVWKLSVVGKNNSGNTAIAAGAPLYLVPYTPAVEADANAEPPVEAADAIPEWLGANVTTGTFFGYALEAVTSGATATIKVRVGY